jgi:hypothetical protein
MSSFFPFLSIPYNFTYTVDMTRYAYICVYTPTVMKRKIIYQPRSLHFEKSINLWNCNDK